MFGSQHVCLYGNRRKQAGTEDLCGHAAKNRFVVRTKPVKRIRLAAGVYQWKGNFDVELTLDVVSNLGNFDTLVLMSGDSDFAPLLDRVKQRGKRVIVMSVKGHISKELLERAKYVNLKKLRAEIELPEKSR